MTNEDKKLIADYMELIFNPARMSLYEYKDGREFKFNSTDTSFCVQEMQKRGDDYVKFIKHAYDMAFDDGKMQFHTVTAWLFNAEDFFNAMAAWIKEGKK